MCGFAEAPDFGDVVTSSGREVLQARDGDGCLPGERVRPEGEKRVGLDKTALQLMACASSLFKCHSANLILPQGVQASDLETRLPTSGNLLFTGKTDLGAELKTFMCYGAIGAVIADMKTVLSCGRIGLVSILLSGRG